jgi:peptidyl-prolyl cis-trans isomerase SurA
VTAAILPLLALLAAAPRETLDRVAATVEGEVVTLSEIEERAGPEYERAGELPPGKERDEARAAALRRAFDLLVAEKLLAKEAKALGLEVTEQQVDAAVDDIRTRNRFSDEDLTRALSQQGLDRAAFRAQVRRELETFQVVQQRVRGRVKVSDEDLRNYYQSHPQEFEGEEEIHVRHIFLPLAEDASAAEEAKARAAGAKVIDRLEKGEDFARVARQVSKGPSAEDGGDLGWLRRGTIQKTLEDAAFSLKNGQISGLVRAGPGLHVLKVDGRRRGGAKGFEDAKEEIRVRLLDEQAGSARQQYLEELRRNASVDVKIPELKG